MLVLTLLCQIAPDAMVRVFNRDPEVVRFGAEYLRIISWNFVASGVVFVGSSVFQGMGNTLPPLASSLLRLLLFAVPAYALARHPGFEMRHVWYVSLASVAVQTCLSLWLLHREFGRKLRFEPGRPDAAVARPGGSCAERCSLSQGGHSHLITMGGRGPPLKPPSRRRRRCAAPPCSAVALALRSGFAPASYRFLVRYSSLLRSASITCCSVQRSRRMRAL